MWNESALYFFLPLPLSTLVSTWCLSSYSRKLPLPLLSGEPNLPQEQENSTYISVARTGPLGHLETEKLNPVGRDKLSQLQAVELINI